MKQELNELKSFLILWSTQAVSQLGSTMTSFALTQWLYQQTGSALQTALLSICSYAPYVVMSIFAGALSDKWDKKKTMLACDTVAALCTVAVLILLKTDALQPWHMYVLNALNGLMNTVQSPAGDVAMTLITPKRHYQRASGLRSFSASLVDILHPMLAMALFSWAGMDAVIAVDLTSFAVAFIALWLFVRIPAVPAAQAGKETLLQSARSGLRYLRQNPMILTLIAFLAGVNLVASGFDATLPAYVLPRANGGKAVLGLVTSCAGIATLLGSVIVHVMPVPRNRLRVITWTLLFSLGTENYLLAFAKTPFWWCVAQVIGWLPIPLMNANLDVVLRSTIPADMQGRVYSCRNTCQFFTIPIGYFLGGWLVDTVCEPWMAVAPSGWKAVFGAEKGAGAALMMLILAVTGTVICLVFGRILRKYRFEEHAKPAIHDPCG
ncbi:MAG: MFS transporter [Clostridia bacterium]|nr:MFS transporter [Clostridia bacterium]